MGRIPFVCGNWKCHKTIADAVALVTELKNTLGMATRAGTIDVAVAPPFTAIAAVVKRLEGTQIGVAGQSCHWEDQGAFTGEISAPMLYEAGARFVILGHSERRQLFGELDQAVSVKTKSALRAGLSPIVCVGETLGEREAGETMHRVGAQLDGSLAGIGAAEATRVTIAYEPVWAIGTGRNASPAQAQEVHAFIRGKLAAMYGAIATGMRIQYGGSVKPSNAVELMAQPDIDGALVGGASLVADQFVAIARAAIEKGK